MYLIIGVWGGPNRVYAAVKFFLYTLLGSLLMLVALIYLYRVSESFSILDWYHVPLSLHDAARCCSSRSSSPSRSRCRCGRCTPGCPTRTSRRRPAARWCWRRSRSRSAPTASSASSCRSCPTPSRYLSGFVITLSLIAVVYIGFVALVQGDMKKLIAYSSISHMGFVTLGFFLFSQLGRRGRAGADDLARLRLGRDVPLRRRDVRPRAQPADRRLRRRRQHHAEVRRVHGAVRDGQRRPAGDLRLRRRVPGDPGRRQGQLLARLPRGDDADPRRRLHAVDGQARDLRRRRQRARAASSPTSPAASSGCSRSLAVLVIAMGVYPKPFVDVMHTSVADLLAHVAQSKL